MDKELEVRESAGAQRQSRLREANQKAYASLQAPYQEQLRESIKRSYRLDINDPEVQALIDVTSSTFSARRFQEAVYSYCAEIREANEEGAFGAILRAGVQMGVNNMYNAVPTTYEGLVKVVPSNKAIELYAPLLRAGFPRRKGTSEEPARQKAQGIDIQIKNAETAGMMEFAEILFEDDQTNQIAQQPSQMGQNAKIVKDAWAFQRWLGSAGTDPGGDIIPASQTGAQAGETTWPYNVAFSKGGGQNRLTSYAAFSQTALQQAYILGLQMLDAGGRKMLVNLDTLVHGVGLEFAARALLNSQWYPATSAISSIGAGGAVGTSTGIGTNFAENVMKGLFSNVSSRWLPNKAYGLAQAGEGLILQERRPLRVLQENPMSGPAFTCRVFRFLVDERWEIDWIEPRFSVLCSDGTV